jgi:hypothetical protein
MAILTKGHTFADGDQVTSTKLNNLVDLSTFQSGAVDGVTLLLDALGYLKVGVIQTGNLSANAVTTAKIADSTGASDGITTAKIATGAVTTAKIADLAVTTAKIAFGTGAFPIQVQQAVKTDTQDITGGTWTDISSLSLAFTRIRTTSKVRVQAMIAVNANDSLYGTVLRIVRDGTPIGVPATAGSRILGTGGGDFFTGRVPCSTPLDFIDDVSAVPTNPLTYKIQAYIVPTITSHINKSFFDATDSALQARTISTMTLTELA